MIILGIGGILGDAASAILKDGELVAAVEESKLVRRRLQWSGSGELPQRSMATCLELASVKPEQVDVVAIARPFPEAESYVELRAQFPNSRILVIEHHRAHAASAYFCSPFEEATVLTLDRGGSSLWHARGARMTLDREEYSPDSLGHIYGRVTKQLGFEPNVDEHKVQWLSVSGDARAHIAADVQKTLEAKVIAMAGDARNICLAGGLGLNALLVSALESHSGYENVFVQPASGNAGTSIGAALDAWHGAYGQEKRVALETLCLGPSFIAAEIKQVLENCKLRFHYMITMDEVIASAVAQLNEHKIVAWMHGRMEFGARALGNRSILASPLNPYSTENLNLFIKHREQVRKFAASVPAELSAQYFEVGANARYLATVGRVKPEHREKFGAAILADDLVRVHTVDREENPLYWRLLHAAGKSTGLPVLYNTSFNLFGEPLVCTPRDAVRSFYSSGIDAMFVGNFLLQK